MASRNNSKQATIARAKRSKAANNGKNNSEGWKIASGATNSSLSKVITRGHGSAPTAEELWMLKTQPPPPPSHPPPKKSMNKEEEKPGLILNYDSLEESDDDRRDYKARDNLLVDAPAPTQKKKIFSKFFSFSKKKKSKKVVAAQKDLETNLLPVPPPPPPPLPPALSIDTSEVSEMTNPTFLITSPKTLNSDITNPTFFNDSHTPSLKENKKISSTPLKTINPVILPQHQSDPIDYFWKVESDFIEWNDDSKITTDDTAFPLLKALNKPQTASTSNFDSTQGSTQESTQDSSHHRINNGSIASKRSVITEENSDAIGQDVSDTHEQDFVLAHDSSSSFETDDDPHSSYIEQPPNDKAPPKLSQPPVFPELHEQQPATELKSSYHETSDDDHFSQLKQKWKSLEKSNSESPVLQKLPNENSINRSSKIRSIKTNLFTHEESNIPTATNSLQTQSIRSNDTHNDDALNFRMKVMQSSPKNLAFVSWTKPKENSISPSSILNQSSSPLHSGAKNQHNVSKNREHTHLQIHSSPKTHSNHFSFSPTSTHKLPGIVPTVTSNKVEESMFHNDKKIPNSSNIKVGFRNRSHDEMPTDEEQSAHQPPRYERRNRSKHRSFVLTDESDSCSSDSYEIPIQPQSLQNEKLFKMPPKPPTNNVHQPYRPNFGTQQPILRTSPMNDPIQVAGLRLLTAAAIPIQSSMRRFLAQRHALNRMWAIVTLQSYFRRFIATIDARTKVFSCIFIQSIWRGYNMFMNYQEWRFCAIEIQTVVRAFLAKLHLQKRKVGIMVLQSNARMFLAKKQYETKLNAILTIQSIMRTFLVHLHINNKHDAATHIQSLWRMYVSRLWFQFDLVDIIIVQSVVRRFLCMNQFKFLRVNNAVIKIQSCYRSYSQTMNYLHTMADILIIQSVARRYICRKLYPSYKSYRLSELVTRIQSIVRSFQARKRYQMLYWGSLQEKSAQVIQFQARKFFSHTGIKRFKAATKIQAIWRGFQTYTDYIFLLADIVIVQRTIRNFLFRKKRKCDIINNAATTIQRYWRGYVASMDFIFMLVRVIMTQRLVRKYLTRKRYVTETLPKHRAAIIIQKKYKAHFYSKAFFKSVEAAIQIQKVWRGFVEFSNFIIHKFEIQAAITIQRYWRGFCAFSKFIIFTYDVIMVQAIVRRFLVKRRLETYIRSVTIIQACTRMFISKMLFEDLRMTHMMNNSRALAKKEQSACLRIQKFVRAYRRNYSEKIAAMKIEKFFIFVKSEIDSEIKRRNNVFSAKKEKRRKQKEVEDKLLERIWLNTYSGQNLEQKLNREVQQLLPLSKFKDPNEINFKNTSKPMDVRAISSVQRTSTSTFESPGKSFFPVGAPSHRIIQYSNYPRYKSLTRKELSEDLLLEEAYIDAEIQNTKQQKIISAVQTNEISQFSTLKTPLSLKSMYKSVTTTSKIFYNRSR